MNCRWVAQPMKVMVHQIRHQTAGVYMPNAFKGVDWGRERRRKMNLLELAREAGLAVLLDGRIGSQDYTSVSGSLDALLRFAAVVRMASLRERKRCRRSVSVGRLGRREQRLSMRLQPNKEIPIANKRTHHSVTCFPNTASSQIESRPRSLRPALCR